MFFLTGKIMSFVFFGLIKKIGYCFDKYYSGWVAAQFKSIGKGAEVFYPLDLIGGEFVTIGDNFTCGKRFRLNAYDKFDKQVFAPEIVFGNDININDDCHIACIEKIHIGNNVLIAGKVFISDHFHGNTSLENLNIAPSHRNLITKGGIYIEDDVWIGEGVAIFPGVRIGRGSVIGANSVVTKSLPAFSIAVGAPAKRINV